MKQTLSLTRKELAGYFGSPMALIFVGTFLAVTLFTFFWVEAFFARGIADIRPLFRWMPLLLIFLVAALTMRQWSEEQRSGTLEVLLTLPVSPMQLVLGKFLAVLTLVALALALTLFLPLTVSLLGSLDWGPVVGGYLAALLLAAAYAAIGLLVSSRTDNQIVALIVTVLLGTLLYLAGSTALTGFAGERVGEMLRAIGSGSRFESIQRGVLDLRDLAYYLSLTGVFLTLNVVSLDGKRWSRGPQTLARRRGILFSTGLVLLNLVLLNVWLAPLHGLRLDLTAGHEYSLSRTTRSLLAGLREPLLIRGYFSEKTHPLLAPLVPRIRDMLEEYRVAAGGSVQLEVVDPTKAPDVEAEANQVYGISAEPFQVAGRYETSIINSYFDILIRYGDQNVVLTYRDLIEVEQGQGGSLDVRLRNLEYDLTRSIKKVVYGFQSVESVLAALDTPAGLTLYVTRNTLPESLGEVPATIEKVAQEIARSSAGRLTFQEIDPDQSSSPVTRQQLADRYGLEPYPVSLFSSDSFYLHMVLRVGEREQVIFPAGQMAEADVRTAIEAALKRTSTGFLKVVGLWTPPAVPTQDMFGQVQQPLSDWQYLRSSLSDEYEVRGIDLGTGHVPDDVDVLVVVAPQGMSDLERYAVDQYLMRGGPLIVAAGNYAITTDPFAGGLALRTLDGGLRDLLASYGIHVRDALVLDPHNEPFPVIITRAVGGMQVQEVRAIAYPFFVDVRRDAMDAGSPIVANLPAVTLNWVSPITVEQGLEGRQVTVLLQSSPDSWLQSDTNIQPDFDLYPELGFPVAREHQSYPLAVLVQGSFASAFKGKPVPTSEEPAGEPTGEPPPLSPPIEASPETARVLVIGSAEFVDDLVFQISSNLSGERYQNSLKLVQNAVSWATEDMELLAIRARGTAARVLKPLGERERPLWEAANYAIALLTLVAIGMVWRLRRQRERPLPLSRVTQTSGREVER